MEPLRETPTEAIPRTEEPSRAAVVPSWQRSGRGRGLGALVTSMFSIVLGGIAVSGAFGEQGFWMMFVSLGLMAGAAALTPDRSIDGIGASEPARLRLVTRSDATLRRAESNRASW